MYVTCYCVIYGSLVSPNVENVPVIISVIEFILCIINFFFRKQIFVSMLYHHMSCCDRKLILEFHPILSVKEQRACKN